MTDNFLDETLIDLKKQNIKNQIQNTTKSTSVMMMPETRHILDKFYQPHNNILVDLLDDEKWRWS